MKIDPFDKNSANGKYGILDKNPFAHRMDSNTVREIYADGFRNPNRITWIDKSTMLATNIGQSNIEAIDNVLKGHDYEWANREGRFLMYPDSDINKIYLPPANDTAFHNTYPVAEFDHDEGNAIEGGFVYEGHMIPKLKGKCLFGDIISGILFYLVTADLKLGKIATVKEWFVSLNGIRFTLQSICGQNRVDIRFARDENGEVFIFTKPDGKIYRLSGIDTPPLKNLQRPNLSFYLTRT